MGIHINSDTRAGTNSLHGTAYDYIQNDVFNAKPWLAAPSAPVAKMRFNQFGGVVSGPVVIPHLYNGRNKTFFTGSYEGLRQYQENSSIGTVPTLRMRSGNFSELLVAGNGNSKVTQLYNPTTAPRLTRITSFPCHL
jgi:hypothetical protein